MKRPVPVTLFIPYGAKYRELRKENIDVANIQPVFIQIVRKPERLCIIKRGTHAEDYFPCCEELSCDVWGMRELIKSTKLRAGDAHLLASITGSFLAAFSRRKAQYLLFAAL